MLTHIQPSFKKLRLEIEEPIAHVVLNNPPINVLDLPGIEELGAALAYVEKQQAISTVVLSGAGTQFSAGIDIAGHAPEQLGSVLAKFHEAIRLLANSEKVTVAAVTGNCAGSGAELALVCDMVFCTEDTTFQFPEIQLACFPSVAVTLLAPLVGPKRAAEMVLTGNVMHGDEALQFGMVNDAVADDSELSEVLQEVTGRLASLSPTALRLAKKAMHLNPVAFEDALRNSERFYEELAKSEDAKEGVRAWAEKRPPVWTGR